MDIAFLLFHFVLSYTQQNDMLGNCNFKKSGGPGPPGPSDATPMRTLTGESKGFY